MSTHLKAFVLVMVVAVMVVPEPDITEFLTEAGILVFAERSVCVGGCGGRVTGQCGRRLIAIEFVILMMSVPARSTNNEKQK